MSSRRLFGLVVAPAVLVAPALAAQDAVRVHVKSTLYRGERAHVGVSVAATGYLLVLRADTYGRVHILYPQSPEKNGWISPRRITLRSPGSKHAFVASETDGEGLVLAALSERPYSFNLYTTSDGRWDRALLGQQQIATGVDAEEGLLDIVRRMAGSDDFDYDLVVYEIRARTAGLWYPLAAQYYDRWDGCYRPLFGSRRSFLWRWGYPYAPIGVDAFDYYFNYNAYRAWCGYAPGWDWRGPLIVVTNPPAARSRPGRFAFKDQAVIRRPPNIEPRRRDTASVREKVSDLTVRSSPFRMATIRWPAAGDAQRGRVSTQRVRTRTTRDVWRGFEPGTFITRGYRMRGFDAWIRSTGHRGGAASSGGGGGGGGSTGASTKSSGSTMPGWTRAINVRRPN